MGYEHHARYLLKNRAFRETLDRGIADLEQGCDEVDAREAATAIAGEFQTDQWCPITPDSPEFGQLERLVAFDEEDVPF